MENLFTYLDLYFDDPVTPDPEPDPDPADDEEETTPAHVGTADVEPAISIDHINRINEGYKKLMEVLGVTSLRSVPAAAGIKIYKTTCGDLAEQVEEGEEINLTKVERKLVKTISIGLNKYRKKVTAEAIQSAGYENAVNDTDRALINKVRKYVKSTFFSTITDQNGTAATAGANLQAACANALAGLLAKYEDEDVTPLFVINLNDVYTYLGSASISTQNAFGFQYLKDFLGMGDAIITASINSGKVYCTAKENINGAIPDGGSDVATAMGMTADESNTILMKHYTADSSASLETLLMTGATFYAEDVSGVFGAAIGE